MTNSLKKRDFVFCDCCGFDVLIPHNAADCANHWKRECMIARGLREKMLDTRRERIATAAMQGLLANSQIAHVDFKEKLVAAWAVDCADALITELDKEGKP